MSGFGSLLLAASIVASPVVPAATRRAAPQQHRGAGKIIGGALLGAILGDKLTVR